MLQQKHFTRLSQPGITIECVIQEPALPYLISTADTHAQRPGIDFLMAGATIFRFNIAKQAREILLLQRAPTDSFPLKWEIPAGGYVSSLDASLVDTAVRELWEEAGLRAVTVVCPVGMRPAGATLVGAQPVQINDEETDADGLWCDLRLRGKTWSKIVFLVEVREGPVRIDELEHVAFRWITEREMLDEHASQESDFELISEALRRNVVEAFRIVNDQDKSG